VKVTVSGMGKSQARWGYRQMRDRVLMSLPGWTIEEQLKDKSRAEELSKAQTPSTSELVDSGVKTRGVSSECSSSVMGDAQTQASLLCRWAKDLVTGSGL
jgi:hypothetical protein